MFGLAGLRMLGDVIAQETGRDDMYVSQRITSECYMGKAVEEQFLGGLIVILSLFTTPIES